MKYSVLALIGDGATTGGLAYEGLNDAGASHEPLIVILNDNEMSIAHNVGGMAHHLSTLRTRPGYFGIKRIYRTVTHKIPGGKTISADPSPEELDEEPLAGHDAVRGYGLYLHRPGRRS